MLFISVFLTDLISSCEENVNSVIVKKNRLFSIIVLITLFLVLLWFSVPENGIYIYKGTTCFYLIHFFIFFCVFLIHRVIPDSFNKSYIILFNFWGIEPFCASSLNLCPSSWQLSEDDDHICPNDGHLKVARNRDSIPQKSTIKANIFHQQKTSIINSLFVPMFNRP